MQLKQICESSFLKQLLLAFTFINNGLFLKEEQRCSHEDAMLDQLFRIEDILVENGVSSFYFVNKQNIILMKYRWNSFNVAQSVNEHLIKKVGKFIHRREGVLNRMNRYCFDNLSHLIEQTNNQITLSAKPNSSIEEVQDISNQMLDTLMSVPDSKVVNSPSKLVKKKQSKSSQKRQRKSSYMYTRQRRSITCSDFTSVFEQMRRNSQSKQSRQFTSNTVVPLEMDSDQEEDKYVQVLRVAKELQSQQEDRERERLMELNKKKVKVDLSNDRVMYDFECKISKLEVPKVRQMSPMIQISGWAEQEQNVQNRSPYNTSRADVCSMIRNTTNITVKDQEKQKIRYAKTKYRKTQVDEEISHPSLTIVVNPQTHKITEKAYELRQEGIKLKIEDREISYKKEASILKETSIKRRISKSEYFQFKKMEEKRKRSMLMKFKADEKRMRAKSEMKIIPELMDEEPPQNKEQEKKLQLRYPKSKSDNGSSRIVISNELMRTDLLRDYKEKQSLKPVEKPTASKTEKSSLSSVDKYNLMYVKYGGRPPSNIMDVARELRYDAQDLVTKKEKMMSNTGKKYSWVGTNRFNTVNNSEMKERVKTQI